MHFKVIAQRFSSMADQNPFAPEDVDAINNLARNALDDGLEHIDTNDYSICSYLHCLANAPFTATHLLGLLQKFIQMRYPEFNSLQTQPELFHQYFDEIEVDDNVLKMRKKFDILSRMKDLNLITDQDHQIAIDAIVLAIDSWDYNVDKNIAYMHLFQHNCIGHKLFVDKIIPNLNRQTFMLMVHNLPQYYKALPLIMLHHLDDLEWSFDASLYCRYIMFPEKYEQPQIHINNANLNKLLAFLEYMSSPQCHDLLKYAITQIDQNILNIPSIIEILPIPIADEVLDNYIDQKPHLFNGAFTDLARQEVNKLHERQRH